MEIDPNRTPAHPFRQQIAHSAFPETTAILAMDALRGYSAGWLSTPVQSTLSGKASGFCLQNSRGTDDETRTHTACATAPSRYRVYQFHHVGASACRDKLSFYVFRRTVTMFCIKHISFISPISG